MKGALLFALALPAAEASGGHAQANPIRKVVNMLQTMQKKVEAEGEKEKELFEKFMCYCKNSGGDLANSIADAENKVSELPSAVEEAEGQLAQFKEDLKKAQTDRTAAKAAIAEATAIREKEAAAFASLSGDLKTNIGGIQKALKALEAGGGAAFLQTADANILRNLVQNDDKLLDVDRDDLTAFLSNDSQESTQSLGAIMGILKQMGDTFNKNLDEAVATENEAIKTFDELVASKTKEIEALTSSIETKTKQIGDMGVQIVQMKEDLSDAEESLLEDKKFLADLEKNCATKEKEWAIICKTRSEELLALADTIKMLNDDDALELFKKTLPGAGSSFMQLKVSTSTLREQALNLLEQAKSDKKSDRHRIDYIMLAIRGKKFGFDKVLKMIDDMVALLKTEQQDDNDKKEYCEMQFDTADDKKKALERDESKLTAAIEQGKETITTLTEELKALSDGIVALDKQVAEATEQRKEENSDYTTLMANDGAAKELLGMAKNRLNKFYNPKLYKPPASLIQVSMHKQDQEDAPPPPPEAPGAYKKKGEESTGVIAMIDDLVKELDMEMTEAETEEKLAQEEYEELMADSAAKRAADSKSITAKEDEKANTEKALTENEGLHTSTVKELMATEEYIGSLHGECDWLIQYYDVRKEARNGEIDALKKAKAVLSGADFSLMQTKSKKFLRH
jgi:DNA repair exonuclease SbcCD ATPase subunit